MSSAVYPEGADILELAFQVLIGLEWAGLVRLLAWSMMWWIGVWGISSWLAAKKDWAPYTGPVPGPVGVFRRAVWPWATVLWIPLIWLSVVAATDLERLGLLGVLWPAYWLSSAVAPRLAAVPIVSSGIASTATPAALQGWCNDAELEKDHRMVGMPFLWPALILAMAVFAVFGREGLDAGDSSVSPFGILHVVGLGLVTAWLFFADVMMQLQADLLEQRIELSTAERLAVRSGLRRSAVGTTGVLLVGLPFFAIVGVSVGRKVWADLDLDVVLGGSAVAVGVALSRPLVQRAVEHWRPRDLAGWRQLAAVLRGVAGLTFASESDLLTQDQDMRGQRSVVDVCGHVLVSDKDESVDHLERLINEDRSPALEPISVVPAGDRVVRVTTAAAQQGALDSTVWLQLARSVMLHVPFKRLYRCEPPDRRGYL